MPGKTHFAKTLPWDDDGRFNEAPAKCRGKRHQGKGCGSFNLKSFNEAPAKCRGKLAG